MDTAKTESGKTASGKTESGREVKYNFKEVESRWQKHWEKIGLYNTPELPEREKFYMLVMFAYPSGDIHMGHFRNYIIGDAIARRQMMLGKQVLHPFGWDAFGLPAERAAIKRNLNPAIWTEDNIKISRDTLSKVGISFDWKREVVTSRPDYYRWTQWMFLRLFEKGLAYRKGGLVNWCPGCQTVLANEQVVQGICERCDSKVEKKELEQWYFRLTAYADRLIDDLDKLPGWPDSVKTLQRDWIGRSYGADIEFRVENSTAKVPVFTTRLDTIFGATFLALAPESPLVAGLPMQPAIAEKVAAYRQSALAKTEIDRSNEAAEKDGVFTGCFATNPYNNQRVQIWVGDYVLAHYGTGAVMGVPGHDSRDNAFAKKYGLPIIQVITSVDGAAGSVSDGAYTEQGKLINSAEFNGKTSAEAKQDLAQYAEKNGFGKSTKKFKLHDWLISRQRYWGTPIPIIHCPTCGLVPVVDADLPVALPPITDFLPKGRSPLADVPSFMNVKCPKCGGAAQRDPDTMDCFVCSSWYHLRYADPKNSAAPFDSAKANAWLPVDKYVGGITHATGHLIYFRFFTKFLFDQGLLNFDEPARELFNHGMVMDSTGAVMSKSRGNVVSPITLMQERGVDVTRLAMYFTAPSGKEVLWSEASVTGVEKFLLNKLNTLHESYHVGTPTPSKFSKKEIDGPGWDLYVALNQAVKKINDDHERLQFNTVISGAMELVRDLERSTSNEFAVKNAVVRSIIQIIAPLTPHLSEELWARIGEVDSVFRSKWPTADSNALELSVITLAIQIDGKLRGEIQIDPNAPQEKVRELVMGHEKVIAHLQSRKIAKETFVKGRLYSISTQTE